MTSSVCFWRYDGTSSGTAVVCWRGPGRPRQGDQHNVLAALPYWCGAPVGEHVAGLVAGQVDRRPRPVGVDQVDLGVGAQPVAGPGPDGLRSEEHTSELQSHSDLVCRL